MQVLSLVWGILAVIGFSVAFFPFLGSLNWLNIPFSALGLALGIVALITTKEPNKGKAVAGIILCAIAVLLGAIRLSAGGGIL
jgi:hypothetical protein